MRGGRYPKYLAFRLGPQAGGQQWIAAVATMVERCRHLVVAGLSSRVVASRYASRAVSIIGSLGLVMCPPRSSCTVGCARAMLRRSVGAFRQCRVSAERLAGIAREVASDFRLPRRDALSRAAAAER